MIQNQTEISIKDNSGILKGRVVNSRHKTCTLGQNAKIVITKARVKTSGAKNRNLPSMMSQLQDALIIQTNCRISRYDGSGLRFYNNSGVAVTVNKRKLVLGFKRITSCVPFEIKRVNSQSAFKGSYNIMKLAKSLH